MRTKPGGTRSVIVLVLALLALLAAACGSGSTSGPVGSAPPPGAAASKPVASPQSSAAAASAQGASAENSPGGAPSGAAYSADPLNPPVKLRLGSPGTGTEAGVYIALDRGYFREEGLDIEVLPITSNSGDIFAMLASEQLDFSGSAPSASLFNAVARGVGVKLVAPLMVAEKTDRWTDKSAQLVVRQDLVDSGKYKSPKDLNGANIGVTGEGSTSQYLVGLALAQEGLTIKDVRFTIVPFPDLLTALGNKAIDAAWQVEPFISAAEDRGFAKAVTSVGELAPGFPEGISLASASTVQNRPDVVRRFALALLRGQRDYYRAIQLNQEDKSSVYESLAGHTAIRDPKQWEKFYIGTVAPNGDFDPRTLGRLEDFFLEAGVQNQKIDLSQLIDTSGISYAVEKLGRW